MNTENIKTVIFRGYTSPEQKVKAGQELMGLTERMALLEKRNKDLKKEIKQCKIENIT
jgi:hypothetical protein